MANPIDENAVPLEDLPLAERQAMRHDHALLNAYAAKVNAANGLPEHFLNALKNAGERSQSVGANSVSPKGAQGVMQFMPATAKQYGLDDRTDPIASIDAAGRMGADLMKRLGTSKPELLAAGYNGGPNRESLRNGQIPDIKETQDYAKRVSDYIGAQPKPRVVKENNTVPFSDLPPEEQRKQKAWEHSDKNPNYYAPTGSNVENALAGAGKAYSTIGKGIGQLGVGGANFLSGLVGNGNILDPTSFSTDESNLLDKSLMDTKAGMGGNLVGDLALTAAPFGALTKLGMVTKAAKALEGIGAAKKALNIANGVKNAEKAVTLGGALSTMLPTAVASSLIGAGQPVENDQGLGTRALNAGIGAITAPIGYGIGALGRYLGNTSAGKAVSDVAGKVGGVSTALGESLGLIKPGIAAAQTPTGKAAVQAAMDNGVHIYPQQIKAPGTALNPQQHDAQVKSFTRAIAKNDLGQDTHDLNEALQKASQQATTDYKTVYHGAKIPINESLPQLKAIQAGNLDNIDPRFKLPRSEQAEVLLSNAIKSAESKPVLTGDDMQKVLSTYKTNVRKFKVGDKTNGPDPSAVETLHAIMDTLTESSGKVLSKEKQALLKDTNGRYRRMLELEPTLQNNALGNMSPEAYAKVIQDNYPREFVFGKANQARSDLARYGTTYMTDKAAQKEAASPIGMLLPTLGAIGGGSTNTDHTGLGLPGNIGTGVTLGLIGNAVARHTTPSTNRILASELEKHRGALAELFNNNRIGNAAANTLSAKLAPYKSMPNSNTSDSSEDSVGSAVNNPMP